MSTADDNSAMHPFVEELVIEMMEPRRVSAIYRAPKTPSGLDAPFLITDFLETNMEELSPAAARALQAIEAPGGDHHSAWTDFKWKLTAFTYIQDIFDSVFRDGDDALISFQQYYFYYESSCLLAESILCGLNGFYFASQAVLRPFLEFSLLQNYYYRTLYNAHSYKMLEQYFERGIAPETKTVLKKAMPDDAFSKTIRFRVQQHLGGLSQSTLHPYHPNHSARQHSSHVGKVSFEGLHFWYTTRLALEAALWVYYVNFPLLFHPIDIVRKFGYVSPVGHFVDEPAATAVKRSVAAEDYTNFLRYSGEHQRTHELLDSVKARPDMTDAEIEASWDSKEYGEFPGVWAGYCSQMARQRVARRTLAMPRSTMSVESDEMLRSLDTMAGWKRLRRLRPN